MIYDLNVENLIFKSDEEIIDSIGMADLPLIIYFLEKKYNGNVHLVDLNDDCMIRYGDVNVANMSYFATHLHFLKITNGILSLEGNISLPYSFSEKCIYFVKLNDEEIPLKLYDANLDLSINGEKYESRQAFIFSVKLKKYINNKSKRLEISFVSYIDGIRSVSGKLNSYRFMPVADILDYQYAKVDEYIIRIIDNKIDVCLSDAMSDEAEQRFLNTYTTNKLNENVIRTLKIRAEYFSLLPQKNKICILIMDRINIADDNGEAMFTFLCDTHPEIDCAFVIDQKSKDFERLSKIGKVIPYGSDDHLLFFLRSDYILSSQCNGTIENPFGDSVEYVRDLVHRPKRIFLQHGIIKDDMSETLNRFNTDFTGFMTSLHKEYNSILYGKYGYTRKQVWLTGLPRYDYYTKPLADASYILIAPTWRKNLMYQEYDASIKDYYWKPIDGFVKSDFYLLWKRLIESIINIPKLNKKVVFLSHPLIRKYMWEICSDSRVEFWDGSYKEAYKQASLLITDYSSVAFDAAFLRIPVVYYQFDKDIFFNLHSYKKGYFDYDKDGLGPVFDNAEDICNYIDDLFDSKIHFPIGFKHLKFRKSSSCENVFKYIMSDWRSKK